MATATGGRFDFDDGGWYAGGWKQGRAHGHGACAGPGGRGQFAGRWEEGLEVSGVYDWQGESCYEGTWAEGRREGLGVESRGRWIYSGEWSAGRKGRYGVRQSASSVARYDGTWQAGLQDGYGAETYSDGGSYQGQWAKGLRHGYGVRSSAPYGIAARSKMHFIPGEADESRSGFVLKDFKDSLQRSNQKHSVFQGLKSKSPIGSEDDTTSGSDESDDSFVAANEQIDGNVIETYMGEWVDDERSGFGIAERSDGLKYEGEWHHNRKFGYGRTTYKSGLEEKGKYKQGILIKSSGGRGIMWLKSIKFREKVESAVNHAHRASQIALQKADIAISRMATARGRSEMADGAAKQAKYDAQIARIVGSQYAPELFKDRGHSKFTPVRLSIPEDSPRISENFLAPPHAEPSGSAFLDLFKNNPERRPSVAALRRPSVAHLRRPSVFVEFSFAPSTLPQQKNVPQLNYQQVLNDHFGHYYETRIVERKKRRAGIDLEELCRLYGISPTPKTTMDAEMMDMEQEQAIFLPQRRCTLPTAIDSSLQMACDGVARTGSVYCKQSGRREAGARKGSLPDIARASASAAMSREAVAALSAQRREDIRRQEEIAERLRANPLLHLASPELWSWLKSQQLVILIALLNAVLGYVFFHVIL